MLQIGDQIPSANVSKLEGDLPVSYNIRDLLRGHRSLILGVPQAFTPICSQRHIPSLIKSLPRLKNQGLTQFIILAPDNPWAMIAWKDQFPEANQVTFLSDGNHEFIEATGLTEQSEGLFMGRCSKRYAIQTIETEVVKFSIEESIWTVSSTSGQEQADLANAEQQDQISKLI